MAYREPHTLTLSRFGSAAGMMDSCQFVGIVARIRQCYGRSGWPLGAAAQIEKEDE